MPVQPGQGGAGQEGEEHEHMSGGKAVVTVKFLVSKEKLKKVVEAAGDDGDDESGQGSKPGMPR